MVLILFTHSSEHQKERRNNQEIVEWFLSYKVIESHDNFSN